MVLRTDVTNASTTKKHETYQSAIDEIERIVNQIPFAKFVILEPVVEVYAPKIPLQIKEIK